MKLEAKRAVIKPRRVLACEVSIIYHIINIRVLRAIVENCLYKSIYRVYTEEYNISIYYHHFIFNINIHMNTFEYIRIYVNIHINI